MRKIVAIVGSPRGRKSTSYNIVNRIVDEVQKLHSEITSEIMILSELEINMCTGCAGCFLHCDSCVQYDDDIRNVEDELLKADVIIFASPVYAHSITGIMKNFIDRISYWLHILKLTGKYGVIVSVSNSNGNIFVDDYLSKMMEFMGISVIGKIDYSNINPATEYEIEEIAQNMIYYIENNTEILNYELKDNVFNLYKKVYYNEYNNRIGNSNYKMSKEILYWKNNNYFECNTFQDLFDLVRSNQYI